MIDPELSGIADEIAAETKVGANTAYKIGTFLKNLLAKVFSINDIAQSTGTSQSKVMSQAATTTYVEAAKTTLQNDVNIYNVTNKKPLAAGVYYTATAARVAVPVTVRKPMLNIRYLISATEWVEEQFIGTDVANWEVAANWVAVADSEKITQIESDLSESIGIRITLTPHSTSLVIPAGLTTPTRFYYQIPVANLTVGDKIRVQLKSVTGANAAYELFYKILATQIEHVVWTLNADTFYYSQLLEILVTAEDLALVRNERYEVVMQALNSAGLSADTITASVQYIQKSGYIDVAALKEEIVVLDEKVTTVEDSQSATDAVLKVPNIQLTPIATPLVIPAGSTTALRFYYQIPVANLTVGDKIRVQLKSVTGANAAYELFYKILATQIEHVVWTLNADTFYYSQLLEILVTAEDLALVRNERYEVVMQALNSAGLSADTITASVQYIQKSGYIDVGELKEKVNLVPDNLVNTLEIEWRGYSAMTPVKVKKDGTGDFTTIQAAINSITDAAINKQYDIQVYDDYDITDITKLVVKSSPSTYNTNTTALTTAIALVVTKNWVHIRGMNGTRLLKVTGPTNLTASSYQYIQVIYPEGNCIIANFNTVVKGGRYAIHQEANGSTTSPDYHATTIYKNIFAEHLGNFESDGYPSGAWTSISAQANGTTSGQKQYFINCKWKSASNNPFYFHSNANYDEPTEHHFIYCEIIPAKNTPLSSFSPYYGDIGSGQRSLIEIIGCNFGKFTETNDARFTETIMTKADLYMNGGADIVGHSNQMELNRANTPKTLCLNSLVAGSNIDVIGGTAYNDIFGGVLKKYLGSVDMGGVVFGVKRLQNPSTGGSQIFSLPYRLGNCATIPKTLIVNVGEVEYTITFDKNYMKADGSAFAYNTVPVISESSILADINAVAPTIFSASIYTTLSLYSYSDCIENGLNMSSVTISYGIGVVRDYANGFNAWRLSQVGEIAEGIAGERINPATGNNYDTGIILIANKSLFRTINLGIYGAVAGSYYKCGANGSFVVTTTKSEATFIAIDSATLKSIN